MIVSTIDINDAGPKKFPVPTKARLLINEFTREIETFVYTSDEAEALNSYKNKIYPTELIIAKDEAICRVLYALSRKNTDTRPQLEQLKEARLFILAWGYMKENEEVAKTQYSTQFRNYTLPIL